MKLIYSLALLAGVLSAQNPVTLQILGDRNSIISGETLQLSFTFHDSKQSVVSGPPVQWSAADPRIAKVGSNGLVQAAGLGITRISATAGSLQDDYSIQVVPLSIRLTPTSQIIRVGDKQQYSATALDLNGAPVPGVALAWKTYYGEVSGVPADQSALINAAGQLTALAASRITVRAEFSYPNALQDQALIVFGSADLRILAPQTYTMRKLPLDIAAKPRTMQLRGGGISLLSIDNQGKFLFTGVLDGTANGLLKWDSGSLQMLLPAGIGGSLPHSLISNYTYFSMNNAGDMLVQEDNSGGSGVVSLFSGGVLKNLAGQGSPIGAGQFVISTILSPASLSDSGATALLALYNTSTEQANTRTGLFRGDTNSFYELVVSNTDSLPGLPAPFTFGNYAAGPDGAIYFTAIAPGASGIFRSLPGNPVERILGTGDSFGGIIQSIRNTVANSPAVRVASNGDLYFAITMVDNRTILVRAPGGDMSQSQSAAIFGTTAFYSVHPEFGILFDASTASGAGIFRWNGNAIQGVGLYSRTALAGSLIQFAFSCAFSSSGTPACLVRTDDSPMSAVVFSNTPAVLFRDGDTVAVTTPLNIGSQIGGNRNGLPQLTTGGTSGSIAQVNPDSTLTPTVVVGNLLSAGNRFSGTGTSSARRSANGDLYFVSSGIYRSNPAGLTTLISPFISDDGATVTPSNLMTVSSQGTVAFLGSRSGGGSSMHVNFAGATREILRFAGSASSTNLAGYDAPNGLGLFAADDLGRVLINYSFASGTSATFLWSGDVWQTVVEPNRTIVAGQKVITIPTRFRSYGRHLLAQLRLERYDVIAEWNNSGWDVVVDGSRPLPNGAVFFPPMTFDVNSVGDLVISGGDTPESTIAVQKADGSQQIVWSLNDLMPGDALLFAHSDVTILDDKTVYITALNQNNQRVLYEAKPLN